MRIKISMKSSIRKSVIIAVVFVAASLYSLVFNADVFAYDWSNPPIVGSDRGQQGGIGHNTGNYSDPYNLGAFWVKFIYKGKTTVKNVVRPNGWDFVDLNYVNTKKKGQSMIYDCKKNTPAYILISPLTVSGYGAPASNDSAMKAQMQYDYKSRKYVPKKGNLYYNTVNAEAVAKTKKMRLPKGVEVVSTDYAKKQFNKFAKQQWEEHQQKWATTDLGWFCSEPGDSGGGGGGDGGGDTTTPPPSTTTSSTTITASECGARASREWGDTQTRIAVRNQTLDGDSWAAKDKRQGLPTDSGWTDGSGNYFTIAKPGDGIKFKHEFCAGDRFVRRTAHQGRFQGSDESHDQIFDITPNTFQIGANKEKYTFGNGVDWVNKKGKSITAYEDLFAGSDRPNGVSLTYNGYGVSVSSPTSDNKDYKCAKYEEDNPYIKGTYQIPGFDAGKCKSSEKTKVSNPVGSTITQWHEFNMVKAWERYSHNRGGSCGCEVSDAWHGGSFDSPEYGRGAGSIWGSRTSWQCGTPSKTCNWSCDKYNIYDECVKGSYKDYVWPLTEESTYITYQSLQKDYGMAKKTAHVYVPYNYSTLTSSSMSDNGVLFQGANAEYKFTWKVEPRKNDKLSDFEYATVTPPNTEVKMVEFLYHPDNKKVEGNEFTKDDPATFFKKKGAIVTNSKTIKTGNQNPNGLYDGKKTSKKMTSVVPDDDEWVGYKYCVAVGIFPSDSHDDVNGPGSNNSLEMQYTNGKGAMDAGSYWNVSGATCRTISKKPSIQVWNGSIYTNGAVNTFMSQKIVNAKLGSDINAPKDLFGSWTDYALIAGKDINGMVSGAALGFNNNRYDLSGNGGQPDSSDTDEKLNPLTIANQTTFGNSGINASTAINMNLERLRSRYSEKASNLANNETNTGSQSAIISSKTGLQFVYHNGNLKTSVLAIRHSGNAPNQTTYRDRNGNLIKGLGDGKNDNTLVIYVKGNLIIDNNICLGDGCKGTGMQLIDYGLNRKTNSAAKLPQVLIFADNISIAENVTRVDAWLIAQDGEINTCAEHTPNSVVAKDARQRFADGNCDKTLMINGPIYAYDLVLPRTAGATHGYSPSNPSDVLYRQFGAVGNANDANLGSATPAEIFNLRADVYLWAYNQAQRYSEAIVTYKRELAPRY